MGPVGFEASVRVPLLVGFIVHYYNKYKIILAEKKRTRGRVVGGSPNKVILLCMNKETAMRT